MERCNGFRVSALVTCAVVLLLMGTAIGASLAAQEVALASNAPRQSHTDDGCNNCSPICGVGYHLDECGVTGSYQWSGINCYNYCHQGVSCTGSHTQGCNPTLGPSSLRAVLAAAEGGDVEVLVKYLETSSYVDLNDARRAIQVGGCSGLVIASITLPGDSYERLLGALADVALGKARGGAWPAALMAVERNLW